MKKIYWIFTILVLIISVLAIASITIFPKSVNAAGCCQCSSPGCCVDIEDIGFCDTACGTFCGFPGGTGWEGYTCSAGICVPEFKDYLQMIIGGVIILGACLFFFRKR
ncbi:hypothetical protein HZA33_01585 [Candidatus Pacearchaeota archaeon]|nr:hypothetical protein [Candidatus Pacearchaeota archaeon]